ncbi:hypothetical protein [uncultured Sphingomonas sp.]|uniref:hypothetical protein n=1 Tax=uncultured Sphingomonas sp. TaxID=158754 RepID=UPI0035C95E4D
MSIVRIVAGAAFAFGLIAAMPASAQFFLKPHDFSGTMVRGDEPGIAYPMPGATEAELRAGLVWNLRSALNVAALQCDFEPSLLTADNYNATLRDHRDELKASFDTLTGYFARAAKGKAAGQKALDTFGTRTYSGFATVSAQYGFCQTASAIGREALFTPRGGLGTVAERRMRELRNSLVPWGEQQFPRAYSSQIYLLLPSFDRKCWVKNRYIAEKCGIAPPPRQ